jgi:hypothetical protein
VAVLSAETGLILLRLDRSGALRHVARFGSLAPRAHLLCAAGPDLLAVAAPNRLQFVRLRTKEQDGKLELVLAEDRAVEGVVRSMLELGGGWVALLAVTQQARCVLQVVAPGDAERGAEAEAQRLEVAETAHALTRADSEGILLIFAERTVQAARWRDGLRLLPGEVRLEGAGLVACALSSTRLLPPATRSACLLLTDRPALLLLAPSSLALAPAPVPAHEDEMEEADAGRPSSPSFPSSAMTASAGAEEAWGWPEEWRARELILDAPLPRGAAAVLLDARRLLVFGCLGQDGALVSLSPEALRGEVARPAALADWSGVVDVRPLRLGREEVGLVACAGASLRLLRPARRPQEHLRLALGELGLSAAFFISPYLLLSFTTQTRLLRRQAVEEEEEEEEEEYAEVAEAEAERTGFVLEEPTLWAAGRLPAPGCLQATRRGLRAIPATGPPLTWTPPDAAGVVLAAGFAEPACALLALSTKELCLVQVTSGRIEEEARYSPMHEVCCMETLRSVPGGWLLGTYEPAVELRDARLALLASISALRTIPHSVRELPRPPPRPPLLLAGMRDGSLLELAFAPASSSSSSSSGAAPVLSAGRWRQLGAQPVQLDPDGSGTLLALTDQALRLLPGEADGMQVVPLCVAPALRACAEQEGRTVLAQPGERCVLLVELEDSRPGFQVSRLPLDPGLRPRRVLSHARSSSLLVACGGAAPSLLSQDPFLGVSRLARPLELPGQPLCMCLWEPEEAEAGGPELLVVGTLEGALVLARVDEAGRLADPQLLSSEQGPVYSAAVLPSRHLLLGVGSFLCVCGWNLAGGLERLHLLPLSSPAVSIACSAGLTAVCTQRDGLQLLALESSRKELLAVVAQDRQPRLGADCCFLPGLEATSCLGLDRLGELWSLQVPEERVVGADVPRVVSTLRFHAGECGLRLALTAPHAGGTSTIPERVPLAVCLGGSLVALQRVPKGLYDWLRSLQHLLLLREDTRPLLAQAHVFDSVSHCLHGDLLLQLLELPEALRENLFAEAFVPDEVRPELLAFLERFAR